VDDPRFEERLWYPTWPFVLLLGFCCLVGVVGGVVTDTDATGWIWVFAALIGSVLFWATLLKLSYRRLYTRVGEHTLELGRNIVVPRESVRESRIVEGAELKQLKAELREGGNFFNAGHNPRLRGLVMMPGAKTAVYLKIDPPIRETDTFVVATKRPEELLAAVQGGAVAPRAEPAPALG
jgi:Protein of unknown function (DUF3093)